MRQRRSGEKLARLKHGIVRASVVARAWRLVSTKQGG